jgi:hypothetical protein
MRALHHPPPGFETCLVLQGLSLRAPRSDGRREPELVQQVSHLVVILAFVQTQPLRGFGGGVRPFHRYAFDGLARQLAIMPIRAGYGQPEWHATAVGEDAAFGAQLAAVRGVLAHLFPPKGAWVIAPSIASHAQSMPCKAS